ncbi:MAG: hypothetical protein D6731_03090 [Planctomycetota bacterium]|nr:MAG: hypothetical protein D6731_03090 [Planctomycetota bacterium]
MSRIRLTVFACLGALLLFGLEPLVGRLLLPSCGGSFAVWATCLMFFQAALFLGYLYCHLLAPRLGRGHLLVALLPFLFLPIGRGLSEVRPDPAAPVGDLLTALAVAIGLPFAVLSSTGVMAQRWLAASALPGRDDPYPLFAASNAGSLAALLGYPLLVEPVLGLSEQRWLWSLAYLGYAVLCFWAYPRRTDAGSSLAAAGPGQGGPGAAVLLQEPDPTAAEARQSTAAASAEPWRPSWGRLAYWTALAAAPSACLLAVTNVIALDLGSAPFVWVVPLSLYLLSFILVFRERSVSPRWLRAFWPELTAAGLLLWFAEGAGLEWYEALVHLAVLGAVCFVGHGALYRDRPAPQALTAYYLAVALGGWIGGAFVSLGAPRLFDGLAEYPLSVLALGIGLALGERGAFVRWLRRAGRLRIGFSLFFFAAVGLGVFQVWLSRSGAQERRVRNVYGVYRIQDVVEGPFRVRRLTHARTVHGKELLDPRGRGRPIGFFHANAPLGQALRALPRPRRVAVIGLGAGALAGHLEAGDRMTFYELDPLVQRIAERDFGFLAAARARGAEVHVVLGDARLELRKAPDDAYDLLVVDAFSSDAIPTHLLTEEALGLYLRKVSFKGVLVFHISNRYYDLRPVLAAAAERLGLAHCVRSKLDGRGLAPLEDPTKVYALARTPERLAPLRALGWSDPPPDLPRLRAWTDDHANLLGALWAGFLERRRLARGR